jgi:hypothetical protein
MPTTLRFLFLLMLGLIGLQSVAYSYPVINFVSPAEQCTYVSTVQIQVVAGESAAPVPLYPDRVRATAYPQADFRSTENFIAAETTAARTGTELSTIRYTQPGESFIRYESPELTTRITPGGGVTPGTFAAPAANR